MKKLSCLAIVGIFALGVILAGCGNLKKKEFDQIFTEYKSQQDQVHMEMNSKITDVDQKVDKEVSDRKAGVDAAMKAANDAMAAAEQGDVDTLEAAKAESNKVRQEARRLAKKSENRSKKFAESQAEKVRREAQRLANAAQNKINSVADAADRANRNVVQLRGEVEKMKRVTAAVVYFGSGRATLTKKAKAELDKAVDVIKKYPGMPVIVKGHADGRPVLGGKYQSNWDLSQARADAVAKYLKSKGVDNPVEAIARAHTEPVAPAFTKEGRAKNRRAEVIIYPSGSEM